MNKKANLGAVEERDVDGRFIAYHVMPMVLLGDESVVSAAHTLSKYCDCKPDLEFGNGGWKIYNHHDPEHPGSIESESKIIVDERNILM